MQGRLNIKTESKFIIIFNRESNENFRTLQIALKK